VSETPITKAQRTLDRVAVKRPLQERAAYAMTHEAEMAEVIRDLLAFIEGHRTGFSAELKRANQLAFDLLFAIAPLFARERPTYEPGPPPDPRQWLRDRAPHLQKAYESACEFLNVEFTEGT
jgi:hypothetical protein